MTDLEQLLKAYQEQKSAVGQRPVPLTPPPQQPAVDPPSGLVEYWRFISSYKEILTLFAGIGALIGFLVGLPKEPVYRARTSLEVLELNEDFMNMKQANPISTSEVSLDTSESQTQVKILESDALMKRVLETLDPGYSARKLHPKVESGGEAVPAWKKLFHLSKPDRVGRRLHLLQEAAESRGVRVTPRTRILELTIDSTSPPLAADFANTLAKEYMEESQETRWKSSEKTSEWLANELNETRLKLEHSENALQEYVKNSGLIYADTDTSVESQKLQQIQQELSTATGERISRQSRYELAQKAPPDSLPDILGDSSLRQAESRINELKSQLASTEATYKPEYWKTRNLQAELDSLEQQFNRDRADILQRITNDFQESSRKEKLLEETYYSQTRQIVGQGEKAIQYNLLKREVDSNRQLYDSMLQQLKQSTVASAMRTSNVRILDTAEIPTIPISPNFKVNTILGFVIGLMLGSAYTLIKHHGNRKLREPGELQLWTGLPELGTIPNIFPAMARRLTMGRPRRTMLEAGPATTAGGSNANCTAIDADGVVHWNAKPAPVAEGFRRIVTSLFFAGDKGPPKIMVITSTNTGDGKSIFVANLGIALAEIGRKVLIIDADLRSPCLHELFGLKSTGLSDLLGIQDPAELPPDTETSFVEQVFPGYETPQTPQTPGVASGREYVQRTRIPRLDLLSSGEEIGSADLLYSPHLEQTIEALAKSYDSVLIDTPRMGQLTDARVLARLANGVILIARARHSTRDDSVFAAKQLIMDRVQVLGYVLNDWSPKRPSSTLSFRKYRKSSRLKKMLRIQAA